MNRKLTDNEKKFEALTRAMQPALWKIKMPRQERWILACLITAMQVRCALARQRLMQH